MVNVLLLSKLYKQTWLEHKSCPQLLFASSDFVKKYMLAPNNISCSQLKMIIKMLGTPL